MCYDVARDSGSKPWQRERNSFVLFRRLGESTKGSGDISVPETASQNEMCWSHEQIFE